MKTALLCLLPLVAACAATSDRLGLGSADGPRGEHASLAAPAAVTEGIRIEWNGNEREDPSITGVLEDFARVTGQTILMTDETRGQAQRRRLRKAGGPDVLEVPPEEVVSTVESILILNQFVLVPLHDTEPRLLVLVSLETNDRNQIKRSARYVPAEGLGEVRHRPALLITTLIQLPNTDVRTLSNSMRTMLTDANTQQIIPVGNSNGLILTGFAPDVCALADMLRMIDAQSPPPPEAEGDEPR